MSNIKYQISNSLILVIGLLVVFGIGIILAPSASAQSPSPTPVKLDLPSQAPPTGVNLTLSPVFLNLVTDPGESVASQFKITNNNNFREYLEISIKKFVTSDTGNPLIQDTTKEDEFVSWVSFSESEFSVDPNQTKTIRFSINPPKEANLGYYYSFVVQRITDPERAGVGPAIAGSPAVPVLLLVKSPNAKREVQIVDFKTDRVFYEYLPSELTVSVKNTGNVHIAPSGDIFIDSLWNKEVGVISANKGRGNILPDSTRNYITSWDDGFAVKTIKTKEGKEVLNDKGEAQYSVSYDFTKANKFRFGRYTANLILVYDNGERDIPLEARVSFWIVPWKILGVGLIVVILALLGLRSALIPIYRKIKGKS